MLALEQGSERVHEQGFGGCLSLVKVMNPLGRRFGSSFEEDGGADGSSLHPKRSRSR